MSFAHPEYLVSTSWLAEHLDDPAVRVLDVTAMLTSKLENRAREVWFDAGHIAGSVPFDVASARGALSDPDADLPWMWPTPAQFVAAMAAVGVGPQTRVVLVARTPRPGIDSGTMWCTRAWWTMHHMGVDCAILSGGIEAWEAEGRPLVVDPVEIPQAAPVQVASGWQRARATRADVLAATGSSVCVVDALMEDSFDGSGVKYGPRGGHISGAINVPFRTLIEAETAAFLDADRMTARLAAVDLLEQPAVITYCGGAIAATVDAFCLSLCGHTEVAVYDGSLMEWSADPELPMET
jgi:thiosulfate/3-mercaptopyruvate sulfurtransferase